MFFPHFVKNNARSIFIPFILNAFVDEIKGTKDTSNEEVAVETRRKIKEVIEREILTKELKTIAQDCKKYANEIVVHELKNLEDSLKSL